MHLCVNFNSMLIYLLADLYKIPLPFDNRWHARTTTAAVFVFARMLIDSCERRLAAAANKQCDNLVDETLKRDMYGMMKRRYVEDYLVTNCTDYTLGIDIDIINSDDSLLRTLLNRSEKFADGFMRVQSRILNSSDFPSHRDWALRTKVLDYVEELFFNFGASAIGDTSYAAAEKV